MSLHKQFRSPSSPAAIYGIRPGFNVGDLDPQYKPMQPVFVDSFGEGITVAADTLSGELDLHARAIKIAIYITGAGSTDVNVYTEDDGYTDPVASFTGLVAGGYEKYVGGWASPVSNNDATYIATRYGPGGANSQALTGLNKDTDNNYSGGTYNPVDYLSLDSKKIKIETNNQSSVSVSLEVVAIS